MATAEDQCPRPVERVEQGERLGAGHIGDGRRDQEKRREQSKRDNTRPPGNRKIQLTGNRRRDFSPAEPKARAGTEGDRCDLSERPGEKDNDCNRGKRDAGAGAIGRESSRHAPDGLRDDRDGDELEAVQETRRACPARARHSQVSEGLMSVTVRITVSQVGRCWRRGVESSMLVIIPESSPPD
jgi:hypothetical protein